MIWYCDHCGLPNEFQAGWKEQFCKCDSDTHRMAKTGTGLGRSLSSAGLQGIAQKDQSHAQ
jgi:hypothetical protein